MVGQGILRVRMAWIVPNRLALVSRTDTQDVQILDASDSDITDSDLVYILGLLQNGLLPNCTIVRVRNTRLLRTSIGHLCALAKRVAYLDVSGTPLASTMYRPDIYRELPTIYNSGRFIFIRSLESVADELWKQSTPVTLHPAIIAAHTDYYNIN